MDNSETLRDERGPKENRLKPDLSKLTESLRSIVCGNSKYDPDKHIPLAHTEALKGMTNDMIAARMGISVKTFSCWVGTQDREGWFPELREAVLAGQRLYDAKMVEMLDKIATGRLRTEENEVDVKAALKAIEFWLSRRIRKEFAESQTIDINSVESSDPAALVWAQKKAHYQAKAKAEHARAQAIIQEETR